jgi:iron complex outermembrane recepter protein
MPQGTAFKRPLLSACLLGAALSLAAPAPALAQTAPAAAIRSFDVPAGPLEDALNAYARQARVTLSFDPALVRGRRAAALLGRYDAADALNRLLAGSGLVGVAERDAVVIKPAPPTPPNPSSSDAQTVLPTVRATARGAHETATGPVAGYAARRSASATKTDTPLLQTPQSIAVVGAQQIADQKAASVTEALAYTPGVIADPGYANSYDVLYSRGFRLQDGNGGIYRDGLRLGGSGWATGQQEPYALERVELLKGAASVLFGATAPGGVLNVVTKQPQRGQLNEVIAEGGNHGHRALAADLGQTFSDTLTGRLVLQARDADTSVDHIPNNARTIAPSLRWTPGGDTALTLLAHYTERRTAYIWGVPAEGSLLPSPYGTLPRERFVGEPGFDRQDTRQASFGWLLTQRLGEGLSLHHGLRWIDSENHVRFTNLRGPDAADPRVYRRRVFDELETTRGLSADTRVQAEFDAGGMRHTAIAGIDVARHRIGSVWQMASLGSLNLFAPVYGAAPGPFVPAFDDREQQKRIGLYLQDQVRIGTLTALAGVRRDDVRSTLNGERETTGATSGRVGVVWELAPGIAPFASWSQSFEPVAGTDIAGRRYKPTRGEQFELGLRWQRGDFTASAAAFDLTQTNVLKNRAGVEKAVQTGEVRSRGLELEAKGPVARRVQLIAAYAYTDAKTTRSENPDEIGRPVSYQPRHQASLWTRVDDVLAPGLHAGLGVRHTGRTEDWDGTGTPVPSATTLDALIGYATGPWLLRLNVNNLTDKTTLLCSGGWCVYGDGRRATASLAYRW